MASKVQICNMSLSLLGANTITSLSDNTREAKLCSTFFSDLADRAMVQGSWATTIRRTSLAKTTNTPSFGFTNEFQLPVSPYCLKVLGVNEDIPGSVEYKIEGDKLLTDESSIKIRYIARLTDTADWGVLLTEAMELLLSSYLAMPLTGDKNLAQSLTERYQLVVQNNLAISGQQGSQDVLYISDLLDPR